MRASGTSSTSMSSMGSSDNGRVARTFSRKVRVAEVVENGGVGVDGAEKGYTGALVARLFGKLPSCRLRGVRLVDGAARDFERDFPGAVAVLSYHDHVALRREGHDVDPVPAFQRVELVAGLSGAKGPARPSP